MNLNYKSRLFSIVIQGGLALFAFSYGLVWASGFCLGMSIQAFLELISVYSKETLSKK